MSKPERLSLIASFASVRKHTVSRLCESTLSPVQALRAMRRLRRA